MQFDVFENPLARARGAYPLVAVLQSGRHSLTSLRSSDLVTVVGNIGSHRDAITAALDWLFLGV